ncbi:MAG: sulfite exporter TauE/SafE family protein [Candidatus Aminicenantes bacterium]|nr:sulfite exporter TauE/SafE family protein [Candidatus Aminicenantes bacterium]
MTSLALIIIGFIAGIFAGLFGIGGGIVMVPALVLFAGFPLVKATGTSLAAIMLPVGIFGVMAYYRARILDLRAAAFLATGLLMSVAVGAWLAHALPAAVMRKLYAFFCLYVSWTFIKPLEKLKRFRSESYFPEPEPDENNLPHPHFLALVGIGLLAGVMAGMFGIGGGNIIVPFLVLFLHYPPKRAIATSLAALLPPIGLPGVVYYYRAGTLDLRMAIFLAIGLLLGTVFGAKINISLPGSKVKFLYGLFLIFVALRFLFF